MKVVKDNIYYVGVQDKNLRTFDIIMYTEYGTSYNSYLIRGTEKTVLIETAKDKFFDEYLKNINEVCDPSEIDYIVVNHTEPDHTGSLTKLLDYAQNATVLGSTSAIKFVGDIINRPFQSKVVTENDCIDIGGMSLHFINAPMLHWPDTIYTFIPEAKALFTCDSFGSHYSDDRVFSDLIENDFTDSYKYYFDKIIGPFKNPFMSNALKKIENLSFDVICTGHGPVLRNNVNYYIDLYKTWCAPQKSPEKTVVIPYVSAYGYTEMLANAFERGLAKANIHHVFKYNLVTDDLSVVLDAVSKADGMMIGSPTIVGDALPPVKTLIAHLNPTINKGLTATAFGSFGWSGEAVPVLMQMLSQLKLNLPMEGFKIKFKPTEQDLIAAEEYAKEFAAKI